MITSTITALLKKHIIKKIKALAIALLPMLLSLQTLVCSEAIESREFDYYLHSSCEQVKRLSVSNITLGNLAIKGSYESPVFTFSDATENDLKNIKAYLTFCGINQKKVSKVLGYRICNPEERLLKHAPLRSKQALIKTTGYLKSLFSCPINEVFGISALWSRVIQENKLNEETFAGLFVAHGLSDEMTAKKIYAAAQENSHHSSVDKKSKEDPSYVPRDSKPLKVLTLKKPDEVLPKASLENADQTGKDVQQKKLNENTSHHSLVDKDSNPIASDSNPLTVLPKASSENADQTGKDVLENESDKKQNNNTLDASSSESSFFVYYWTQAYPSIKLTVMGVSSMCVFYWLYLKTR